MEVEYEHMVKQVRALLSFEGFWPDENGEYNLYYMGATLFETFAVTCMSIYSSYVYRDDLTECVARMVPMLPFIIAFYKSINFIRCRKIHTFLLNTMKQKYWSRDAEEGKMVRKTSVLLRYLFYLFTAKVYETTAAFVFTPVLESIFINHEKHPEYRRTLPFVIYIPEFLSFDQTTSPFYEIFYVIQAILSFYCVINVGVFDNLYDVYVLHLCTQLQLIRRRLRAITNHAEEERYAKFCKQYGIIENIQEEKTDSHLYIEDEKMISNLAECIQHHQLLLDIAVILEAIYNSELFLQFFVMIVIICTSLFHAADEKATGISRYFAFSLALSGVIQLFKYSYVGNKLTIEFEDISLACYSSKWYHCSQRIKKDLLIIIMRTQRPVFLTIGKIGIVNLARFAAVVKTGASYFTILKSFE